MGKTSSTCLDTTVRLSRGVDSGLKSMYEACNVTTFFSLANL